MSRRILLTAPTSLLGLLLLALPMAGCSGDDGAPGQSTGTLTGAVTNSANAGAPVANATITTNPAVPNVTITTDASGVYTAELPAGVYTLTCAAANFTSVEKGASVLAAVSQTLDFSLAPTSNVVIAVAGNPTNPAPGDTLTLTATATPLDGSTVQGYAWTQKSGGAATITDEDTASPTITLGDVAAYKQALIDDLPVQDRFEVIAVDPHALELATAASFECEVTTDSGTYTTDVDVHVEVDFAVWATGLRNVPIGLPVLIGGMDQATYDWALVAPGNSSATLEDATERFPWFVPDVPGSYTLTVTDLAASMPFTIEVFAAEWVGGIVGIASDGSPETSCANACHSLTFSEEFDDWAHTGHAAIFTDNINTGGHYGPGCFDCHTVGYHPGVDNSGFDDDADYQSFLDTMFPNGQSHPDPDNWVTVVNDWPNQAQKANIQCENCHGPNGPGGAHADIMDGEAAEARVSTSAAVCGYCHGEPPRHARYQQWLESGHGNFETALAEGTSGSCAKCHSAQGFLDWYAADLDPSFSGTGIPANEVQPITCVVCHDPHNVGTVSGHDNDAPLRVEGDSPPLLAGFTAYGIGKGAMCIVCHNTRRGEANDVITSTPDRAPHLGAQGDVLMGQNAFFVTTGVRGSHSLITDTCTTCHISLTPPPADLSYQLGGTNHTFEANTGICADCHGLFDADSLQDLTERSLEALAEDIERALEAEIDFHTAAGRSVRITGDVGGTATTIDITAASVIGQILLVESHGRAAMDITVDGVVYGAVRLNSDTEIIVGGSADGRLLSNTYSSVEQILAQSQWNYFLLHSDSSLGVHNPQWINEIIAATFGQIDTAWPAN